MFKFFILAAMIILQVQAQPQQIQQLNSDEEIKKFISDNPYAVIQMEGIRNRNDFLSLFLPKHRTVKVMLSEKNHQTE